MNKNFTNLLVLLLASTVLQGQNIVRNDSIISQAMSLISVDSVEYQVQWLQDMGTRFLMEPNRKEVAGAIKLRFESYGMIEVRLDSFECYTNFSAGVLNFDTTTWQYNVEAKITGSLYPDDEIILLGHYDCMQEVSNPQSFAPGADDNASGTVAVLETARVLSEMGYQPEKTIVFLATAAEELMYFGDAGSEHYAEQAAADGRSFSTVINNDMISYNDGEDEIWISNIIGFEQVTDIAALIAFEYTSLVPIVSEPIPYYGADLQPFQDEGWPGVAIMENSWNPYYHTEQDIIENCDMEYLAEAIKISCGTIIYSDISVGMEELDLNAEKLMAYPNPCKDIINVITGSSQPDFSIIVMNASGQIVFDQHYDQAAGNLKFSLSDFPSGLYIMKYLDKETSLNTKIIKM